MERIFHVTPNRFMEKMKDIEAELLEEYVLLNSKRTERSRLEALVHMRELFSFVQRLAPSYRTTTVMLRHLENAIRTEKCEYFISEWIYSGPLYAERKTWRTAYEKISDDAALWAAIWLEYYYRVYEKALHTERENEKVKAALSGVSNAVFEKKLKKKAEARAVEKQPNAEEKKKPMSLPMQLYEHLDESVVGQEALKKKLSMAVYRFMKHDERSVILMIGPSGSGKNFTMEVLAQFPELKKEMIVYTYDASNLTPTGFNGANMSEIFKGYKTACTMACKIGGKGIIYLDEIDKIINPNTDSHGENVAALVQHQLLAAIAGTGKIEGVDTGRIMFILGGAFGSLEKMEKERRKKNAVGFALSGSQRDILAESEVTLREDLLAIGAEKEFLGRISAIVRMEKLTKDELRQILLHEKHGVIKRKQKMYAADGLTLEFDDQVIDLIAEKVYQENLGARSAVNVVEALLGTYDFDMLANGYTGMRVTAEMLEHGAAPVFWKGEKQYEGDWGEAAEGYGRKRVS